MEANKDFELPAGCLLDSETVSVRDDLAKSMAESLMQQRDELIKDAICYGLGVGVAGFKIEDIAPERGIVEVLPDGKETFYFDHVPLVEFYPVVFNTSNQGLSTYWNATQHYRKLYNNNDGGKL